MLLQTVRPNIVQSIRAYRVDDLMQAARHADQHFLYANLTAAQSKQDVLEAIATFIEEVSQRSRPDDGAMTATDITGLGPRRITTLGVAPA